MCIRDRLLKVQEENNFIEIERAYVLRLILDFSLWSVEATNVEYIVELLNKLHIFWKKIDKNDLQFYLDNLSQNKEVEKGDVYKRQFLDYLNILAENSQWINLDILRQMENVMNGYELFSQNGTSKVMMIESVISEFYIFFVVFMSCEFNLPELLERNVDDSRMIWYVSKSVSYTHL